MKPVEEMTNPEFFKHFYDKLARIHMIPKGQPEMKRLYKLANPKPINPISAALNKRVKY
jgi:hypothetical protein